MALESGMERQTRKDMTYLTTDQCQRFDEKGYLIFEALIEPDLNERIKGDVDQMMHDIAYGRRKPGGQHYRRCFIDTSYCQAGTLWPGYRSIKSINAMALEKGFDRNGKYAFFYDTSQFFDAREAWQRSLQNNEGSLAQAPWFPPLSERPTTS